MVRNHKPRSPSNSRLAILRYSPDVEINTTLSTPFGGETSSDLRLTTYGNAFGVARHELGISDTSSEGTSSVVAELGRFFDAETLQQEINKAQSSITDLRPSAMTACSIAREFSEELWLTHTAEAKTKDMVSVRLLRSFANTTRTLSPSEDLLALIVASEYWSRDRCGRSH